MRLIGLVCLFVLLAGLVGAPLRAADTPKGQRVGEWAMPRLRQRPIIDGKLAEWERVAGFRMAALPAQLSPHDLSAVVQWGWDEAGFYLAARVTDNKILNTNPAGPGLRNGDVLDLRLSPQPSRQGDDMGPSDYEIYLAPDSAVGAPACCLLAPGTAAKVIQAAGDPSGISWAVARREDGWEGELFLPFSALPGAKAAIGERISFVVAVYDRDATDPKEWQEWHRRVSNYSIKLPPREWPFLLFADQVPATLSLVPSATAPAAQRLSVSIPRHKPCNLFDQGEPVRLETVLRAPLSGRGQAAIRVVDYFGKIVLERNVPFETRQGQEARVLLELSPLPSGYFALSVRATVTDDAGRKAEGAADASFGIAPFVNRSAAQVREGGYRFGLKMFYLGQAWWRGNAEWDEREVTAACCKLGLQWTRALLQEESELPTLDLIRDFPMNVMLKVERFPEACYDAERYGPLAEWEKRFGKGQWVLKTVPKKAPYQEWLAGVVAKIPAEQKVFEIWNEAWDKLPPEEFARICQWAAEVILKQRPDAVIGPNLLGTTSKYEYDARVIDAGGMQGMRMVSLHPYGKSEDRAWLRDYRRWLRERLGRDVDLYVTEYGSHSTPEGPAQRSEHEQAQRVVAQSLALYAEGVKAFCPHWMGQREQNPTYIEDWFGFFRLNHEPKPVLLAHATSARMVDAGRYVGDLWYGPGVGAMLFERGGTYTLALWAREEGKRVEVAPGVARVTQVDMVGSERELPVPGGKLALTLGPDMTYLVGVSPALAKQATTELNPARWPQPAKAARNRRTMPATPRPPRLDGTFADWKEALQVALVNPKVAGDDASGMGYLTWDEKYLYVGADVRDNEVLNTQPRAKLYREDSIELFVSTEPRDADPGYGPRDHQFFLTPTSGEGAPILGEVADREAGKVVDVPGARFSAAKSGKGWVIQAAIPWSAFSGFTARSGATIALELRLNDADTSHPRWKIDPADGAADPADPTVWSLLVLRK